VGRVAFKNTAIVWGGAQGERGNDGSDGIGVQNIIEYYAASAQKEPPEQYSEEVTWEEKEPPSASYDYATLASWFPRTNYVWDFKNTEYPCEIGKYCWIRLIATDQSDKEYWGLCVIKDFSDDGRFICDNIGLYTPEEKGKITKVVNTTIWTTSLSSAG
jgi:hypothetical protein